MQSKFDKRDPATTPKLLMKNTKTKRSTNQPCRHAYPFQSNPFNVDRPFASYNCSRAGRQGAAPKCRCDKVRLIQTLLIVIVVVIRAESVVDATLMTGADAPIFEHNRHTMIDVFASDLGKLRRPSDRTKLTSG